MKKIVIDARLYGLEHAGLGRYVINLVNELTKLDNKNHYHLLLRKKYYQSLKLPSNWKKVLVDVRHYTLAEQKELPKALKKINPDLVHFPNFNIPLYCPFPYVVTIHDMTIHKSKGLETTTLPFYLYYFKRLVYKISFRLTVKRAKHILTPSKVVKEELVDYYNLDKDRITVTYEGFNPIFSSTKKVKSKKDFGITKPYFFYVGNAYPHKNLEVAIKAIKKLNQEKFKFQFVIVTSKDFFQKRLKEAIKKNGVEKEVIVLGYVTDRELISLLINSQAFLYPSLMEGFGLQGIESMAVGTLVLASDIPIFQEIYKDHAIYFNPRKVSSLANQMKEVIEMDTERRKSMILDGQEFIKRYSWPEMVKQTLGIYQKLLL